MTVGIQSPVVCAYCGKVDGGDLHRDHVVPRSRGGPDDATNIVMACRSCNGAKAAMLPSEWLGDRCPAAVKAIEDRVNGKLARRFKKRDQKRQGRQQPELCALTMFDHPEFGRCWQYCGDVVSETDTTVRIDVVDLMLLWAGFWSPSGELKEFPKSECRIFSSRESCAEAADRLNNRTFFRGKR